MHDTDVEGRFEYTDDTAVDFFNWANGQPDNWQSNEDCIHLRSDGTMNDLTCLHEMTFICKGTPMCLQSFNC